MRVPRTFVFVDLSGFTNYTAAFGDDAAGRILSTFRGIVRTVASDRGVRIAKWLGDGCMVVAVDQGDAIEFVLDLEQLATDVCTPLTIRAGLATGHALLFEGDDYIGPAANHAARLCEAAAPGEVFAVGVTPHLPDWIEIVCETKVQAHGLGELPKVSKLAVSDSVVGRRTAS